MFPTVLRSAPLSRIHTRVNNFRTVTHSDTQLATDSLRLAGIFFSLSLMLSLSKMRVRSNFVTCLSQYESEGFSTLSSLTRNSALLGRNHARGAAA